ncbi:hypothetical protein GE061_009611 [Apolygus lucorum]|uniref:SCP domain-containing protein n=1 Tax=Apolygus lucorum TaxID=248454 RepID=A0A8S9Y103_APOLU|nr:hypothetical protein GE061_009611 [Apolygus lucorum]
MWVQLFWLSVLLDLCYGWTFWKVERNVLTEWCVKELECQINGKTFLNEGCVHRLESDFVFAYQGGSEFQDGLDEKPSGIAEYTREVLNEKQKKEILKLHNDYRNSVAGGSKGLPKASNMRQLTWNDNLETSAAITAWGSSLWRYDPIFLCTQRCHRPTSICLKTPDFEQATQIRQTFTPYPKPFLLSIMDFYKAILSQPVDDLKTRCVHRLESEAVGLTYQGGAEFQEGLEEKPARIKEYTREVLNEKQKKEILKLHNDYRNSVAGGSKGLPKASNVRQLTWNDNLEISAAITAWGSSLYRYDPTFLCTQRCHRPTSICLKTPDFEQATQIRQTFTPYPKPFLTSIMDFFKAILSQPVDDLKTRIPKYNKPSNYATEFLPRMLWAETYKIGCVDVSTSMIWYGEHTKFYSRSHVCNYAPEGTIEGQPVYKEGETCSACPEGTKCRPESLYPNLCATDRDPMNDDFSEDEEEWQPSGDSEDEPQQEDFPEPVEEEAEPHELSLEAEVTTRSLNEIAEKGEQPPNLVVAVHPQGESLEHLEEEFQLADSTIQPNVNSENGILSNDMIIESIFDLEGLDITHKDYAERDREDEEDRDEEGKTRETESEDYAERDGEDRDEEGKTREKESEDNIIDGEDSGKKNLKGSFVLATFQKPRGSFNMVCEVVSQDNTFASVFTYGQVTRNAINRFARTSRETTAIRLDQILEILPSPTKFGFGINIKYEFPIPPLRLM